MTMTAASPRRVRKEPKPAERGNNEAVPASPAPWFSGLP